MLDIDPLIDSLQDINAQDVAQIISTGYAIVDAFQPQSTLIGTPDVYDWTQQIMPDNCAVEAERAILNLFTDNPLSQVEAMFISATNGWYMPGVGTSPSDIGHLLEMNGIPTHTIYDATISDLASELSMGHGLIVGVDSQELWDSGPLSELKQWMSSTWNVDFGDVAANHAVLVTGIDISDPLDPKVILNDSGVPNGQGVAYPLEKFMQAWQDSGFYYTATDISLPDQQVLGNLSDMESIINNLSMFAGGFVGTFVGLETFATTGDIATSVSTGVSSANMTINLVENLFSDDSFICAL